jgi:hypothetical protein
VLVGSILIVDAMLRRQNLAVQSGDVPAGSIPIYMNGSQVANITPEDLENLNLVNFVDSEEGKKQEGWLLKDVLLLYIAASQLNPETNIEVSSSSRNKSQKLTWETVTDFENMVMFDLSGRGTLKLVSQMTGFDTREDWVQDVDKVEIFSP